MSGSFNTEYSTATGEWAGTFAGTTDFVNDAWQNQKVSQAGTLGWTLAPQDDGSYEASKFVGSSHIYQSGRDLEQVLARIFLWEKEQATRVPADTPAAA
jgi:hypothetical protein